MEIKTILDKLRRLDEIGDPDDPSNFEKFPPLRIGDIDPRNGQKILSAATSGDGTVIRSRFGDIYNVKYGSADVPVPPKPPKPDDVVVEPPKPPKPPKPDDVVIDPPVPPKPPKPDDVVVDPPKPPWRPPDQGDDIIVDPPKPPKPDDVVVDPPKPPRVKKKWPTTRAEIMAFQKGRDDPRVPGKKLVVDGLIGSHTYEALVKDGYDPPTDPDYGVTPYKVKPKPGDKPAPRVTPKPGEKTIPGERPFKNGYKNPGTLALQYWLNQNGQRSPIDGIYTLATQEALDNLKASNPQFGTSGSRWQEMIDMMSVGLAYNVKPGKGYTGLGDPTFIEKMTKHGFDPKTGKPLMQESFGRIARALIQEFGLE